MIADAIRAAKADDNALTCQLLSQVVQADPENARAWYLLSQVIGDPRRVIICLRSVLEINPNNVQARQRLDRMERFQYGTPAETGGGTTSSPVAPPAQPSYAAPSRPLPVTQVINLVAEIFYHA